MSIEVSFLFVCTPLYLDSIDFYDTLCFITRNIVILLTVSIKNADSFPSSQVKFQDRFKPRSKGQNNYVTLDGTDFSTYDEKPFDKNWYSFKLNRAGIRYEVGICIQTAYIVFFLVDTKLESSMTSKQPGKSLLPCCYRAKRLLQTKATVMRAIL